MIAGKFDQVNRGVPYASLVQAIRQFIRHILAGSAEEVEAWRERLEKAVSEGRADGIRQAAHAFKSAAGTIRATVLASLLEGMERAAKEGDAAEAARRLPDVKRAHAAAMAQLNSIRES